MHSMSVFGGSLITVAGLTFSVSIVVLQFASGQFSPRILRTFFGDRMTQVTVGTYVERSPAPSPGLLRRAAAFDDRDGDRAARDDRQRRLPPLHASRSRLRSGDRRGDWTPSGESGGGG
jgi:hypothetical protein